MEAGIVLSPTGIGVQMCPYAILRCCVIVINCLQLGYARIRIERNTAAEAEGKNAILQPGLADIKLRMGGPKLLGSIADSRGIRGN